MAICHEYDHLEGVLFTDKASGIREAASRSGSRHATPTICSTPSTSSVPISLEGNDPRPETA